MMFKKQFPFALWVTVTALLNVLLGVANGIISIQQVPQFPEFQGSVMLNVAGIPQDILDFIWFRGPEAKDENRILTYTPKARVPQSNGVKYHGRITAYPNGSLRISNLDIPDKGSYAVQIRTNTTLDVNFVNLKVYKPVGKTTVKTTILPVENEIFSLTCTSANAETIKWTRDNAILPPGAVLTSDKRTVSFSSISREDSGIYQCTGENPISKMTSEPYILTVFYGPEYTEITVWPLENSSVVLECFSDSDPLPRYEWWFDEQDLISHEDTLYVDQNNPQNEGNYTCVAINNITQNSDLATVYVNTTFEISSEGKGAANTIPIVIVIVIVAVLLLALFAALLYLFVIRKQPKKTSNVLHPTANTENFTRESSRQAEYENINVLPFINVSPSQTYENLSAFRVKATEESHYEQLTYKDRDVYSTMGPASGKH